MLKLLTSSIIITTALTGCQTLTPSTPFSTEHNKKPTKNQISMTTNTGVMDSDSDGVADAVEACPATPKHIIVNEAGCPLPVELIDRTTMEVRLFFERNRSELQAKFFPELQKVAEKMRNSADLDLVVVLSGHTSEHEAPTLTTITGDNPKQSADNQFPLGHERVQAVTSYLINKGVSAKSIYRFDCAANIPVAPNETEEGAAMNQRVYGKLLAATDFYTGTGYGHTHSLEHYQSLCQQF